MAKYILRRIVQAVPVLIGITIVVYAILLAAPGGPTARFANNPRVTLADRERFKKAWGLDQAIPVQYCRWMGFCSPAVDGTFLVIFPQPSALLTDGKGFVPNFLPGALGGGSNGILHGDLGISISTGQSVVSQIQRAVLPTIILAGTALVIWILVALFIGVYAAIRRYSLFDQAATVFAYIGYAMPTFWLGLMLIFTFAGPGLDILPAQGMVGRGIPAFGTDSYWKYFSAHTLDAVLDIGKHLIMPVVTLVVVNIAGDSRFVRASMLEAMSQDYVRTARAKGLPARKVIFRHALRNAMLPVVTNIGLEIPFLFTGAIVTETIFNWPGIGNLTIDATNNFDYPTLMGLLLIAAVVTVIANLIADVAYAVVDPRIKY
jgi:peptide/nickel transport system permease protein